jgi:hypothetical protein
VSAWDPHCCQLPASDPSALPAQRSTFSSTWCTPYSGGCDQAHTWACSPPCCHPPTTHATRRTLHTMHIPTSAMLFKKKKRRHILLTIDDLSSSLNSNSTLFEVPRYFPASALCFAATSASTQHISSHATLTAASSATASATLAMCPHQWVSSSSISEIRGDTSGICFCSSTWHCMSDSDAPTDKKKKKETSTKTHLPRLGLRIHPRNPLIRRLDTPGCSHFQKG